MAGLGFLLPDKMYIISVSNSDENNEISHIHKHPLKSRIHR